MAAKQPSTSVRHDGHTLTVTMLEPRLSATGQPPAAAIKRAIFERPKATNANRGKQVPVTGYLVPARFKVDGFRHPVEFEVTATPISGVPILINWVAVGKIGGPLSALEFETQGQISLDNLPLGKLLAAAVKACAFTATTTATDEVQAEVAPGVKWKLDPNRWPPFMHLREFPSLQFVRIGGQAVAVKRNMQALTTESEIVSVHKADDAPINSPAALKRIAALYELATQLGPQGRGYKPIAEFIEQQTHGRRPRNTAQQMISLARKAGYLPKRTTKPKKRGKK